ncbi:prepilin-type N-terminal cleavage/methylation domain-containing protein [Rhodobacter sp. NTK016B]|uniref:PulJ/GspJ family protein n=1 Tax=Rhodobacter sp. NTK016B TaxID=2759676 RepID=UPI001A8F93FD|nr:prepilin-type N-terminal cleavage/methylation domain-containing protein [Rhodobacter sp. NTK016B]MBN8292967.1 prepilin-type N-terminal cleavage/methylation domain-containing protein [Rhodobacter sp. NTK016B]
MSGRRKTRGFTLIELLAAMAILAVVSVMAVQALSGVFFQRSVLTRVDDSAAELTRALSLLRQDLEAIVLASNDDARAQGLRESRGAIGWARGGLAAIPGSDDTGAFGAVEWALDDAVLTRRINRAGTDAPDDAQPVPILTEVTAFEVTALGTAEASVPVIAQGYEARLETRRWGTQRVVVAP